MSRGGLSAQLFAQLGRPLAPALEKQLEPLLAAKLSEAAAKWPEVELEREAFIEQLARGLAGCDDVPEALAAVHAADLKLAAACARGVPAALAVFERRVMSPLARGLARRQPGSGEDVLQWVRQHLLLGERAIRTFAGRGPLRSWVRLVLARRLARVKQRARPDEPLDALLAVAGLSAPAGTVSTREVLEVVHREMRRAAAELTPEQREVLKLHYARGLSVTHLAVALGVPRSTAGHRLLTAREALGARTRALLLHTLEVSPQSLDALVASTPLELPESLSLIFA
ncbi:MAG: hypothetical protein IPJ65_35620 [Archangiaceae bacterium]|nr:hypothetical protein [Archangiaceae bacterium]